MSGLPAAPLLYLITDRHQTGGRPLVAVVESALRGGVNMVQLREKDLTTRALLALAVELRDLTRRHGARLLVNDRVDVALACDADGVHLPADSFRVEDASRLLGPQRLIGVSTHSAAEAAAAATAGADFAVCGPVYETPSKRAYGAPLGIERFAAAAATATIPVLALGGVTAEHVPELRRAGAAGVAIIRAVMAAEDVEGAAVGISECLILNV